MVLEVIIEQFGFTEHTSPALSMAATLDLHRTPIVASSSYGHSRFESSQGAERKPIVDGRSAAAWRLAHVGHWDYD